VNNVSLGYVFRAGLRRPETFSFLGVTFANAVIGRVRITAGNQVLMTGNNNPDLVVMDDFIYGEPVPVPEPSSLALIAAGGLTLAARVVRRRRRGTHGPERGRSAC
jgi:hypothetical protein